MAAAIEIKRWRPENEMAAGGIAKTAGMLAAVWLQYGVMAYQ